MPADVRKTTISAVALTLTAIVVTLLPQPAWGQELTLLEEQAIQQAVAAAESFVVQIEPIGGLETINGQATSGGPTTGVVVSEQGHIISSAFAFARQPASILVTLPSGERKPARIVATDYSRKLTLLKVDDAGTLAPAPAAPRSELKVGNWAIAVGRVFSAERLNISTGIISATHRIWDRAIQTDAKISPANYGGALLDIKGRVIGVLTPMSPRGNTATAGTEWYDSGIGFAAPMEDVYRHLERLQRGDDLRPGVLGVAFSKSDDYAEPVTVATVRAKSPAREAGVQPGDVVVECNGKTVKRLAQLKHALGPLYAGEPVSLVVERGEKAERVTLKATLVDELIPYEHPFLGVLPEREGSNGVQARFIYPDSPADKAGVQTGDRIVSIGGQAIRNIEEAMQKLAEFEARQTTEIEYLRAGKTQKAEIVLDPMPETLLASSPPPVKTPMPLEEAPQTKTGVFEVKIPEEAGACHAWVPNNYDPRISYGLLVLVGKPGEVEPATVFAPWQALAEANHLVLLAPQSSGPQRWVAGDAEFIVKTMESVMQGYAIDPNRVVLQGQGSGGSLGYLVTTKRHDLVRAVVAVNAPFPARTPAPENEPLERFAVLSYASEQGQLAQAVAATVKALRGKKIPVTEQSLTGQDLNEAQREDVVRWIDTLDRL